MEIPMINFGFLEAFTQNGPSAARDSLPFWYGFFGRNKQRHSPTPALPSRSPQ
jgi:hypothetical protein